MVALGLIDDHLFTGTADEGTDDGKDDPRGKRGLQQGYGMVELALDTVLT